MAGPVAVVVASCIAVAACSTTSGEAVADECVGGVTTSSLMGADGISRQYRLFVPSDIGAARPAPVVLNFHGLGSTGPEQRTYTGYESLAAEEDFIVVHPTGAVSFTNSWEITEFDVPDRDDVEFVGSLIDLLIDQHCADPDRIYSTGFSNGGLFTSTLLCSIPDRIAAAVSVGGLTHHGDCSPSRAVPYMAIHGTDDRIVSFDGKGPTIAGSADPPEGSFFAQVIPDEFAQFAADFGCDPLPEPESVGADVIKYDYSDCDDSIEVVFYEVVGGTHVWPGSTISGIDATEDGWEFMSQYSLTGRRASSR